MADGGGAKEVCLNTVAILFLADLDNIVFELGLSERWRSRMEEAGRVELTEAEARGLARTKVSHALLLTIFIPMTVLVWGQGTTPSTFYGFGVSYLPYFFGGVMECFGGLSEGSAARRGLQTVGAWLLGVFGWWAFYLTLAILGGSQ